MSQPPEHWQLDRRHKWRITHPTACDHPDNLMGRLLADWCPYCDHIWAMHDRMGICGICHPRRSHHAEHSVDL